MKPLDLFSTWLVATVLVSGVTYQVLDAADAEVRDAPQTAVVVAPDRGPLVVAVSGSEEGVPTPASITSQATGAIDGSSTVTLATQQDAPTRSEGGAAPTTTSSPRRGWQHL